MNISDLQQEFRNTEVLSRSNPISFKHIWQTVPSSSVYLQVHFSYNACVLMNLYNTDRVATTHLFGKIGTYYFKLTSPARLY